MKKIYILLAILLALSAATLAFVGIGFFKANLAPSPSQEAIRENTDAPQASSVPSPQMETLNLTEKLGFSFSNVDPNVSVQKDGISFYVFCLEDTVWKDMEIKLSEREGLIPIRNGIMDQTHEDAFDLINSRIMEAVQIEYWPSVVTGYSLLLSEDGKDLTGGRLPDPFAGTFLLMDTQKKRVCIYILETQS